MNYSQLIQFKRLEERAFIFLNGKQVMLFAFGFFAGMSVANRLGLSGWPVWITVLLFGILGLFIGARYHGLYGYQYLRILIRTVFSKEQLARPEALYDRQFNDDVSYVLGAPDGGALVQVMRQSPTAAAKAKSSQAAGEDGSVVYRLRPVDLA